MYRRAVRAAAEEVLARPPSGSSVYVPKARDELEPLLTLWPHVLAVPVRFRLSITDMILARAWPIHPLAVNDGTVWADGRWCSPAEMFFHDVDHARFKVREDLLARGIDIADPYRDGTTFDVETGRHRTVLDLARPYVDRAGWERGRELERRVAGWLNAIESEEQPGVAEAARWLLFEMVHEKGLPLDPNVLIEALHSGAPLRKMSAKVDQHFFADHGPSAAAVGALKAGTECLVTTIAGADL